MKLVKRKFPKSRLRRTRMKSFSRKMVSENNLTSNDVIWPLFLTENSKTKVEIKTMPNVYRYPIEVLLKELEVPVKQGLNAIALFPHISNSKKDDKGTPVKFYKLPKDVNIQRQYKKIFITSGFNCVYV